MAQINTFTTISTADSVVYHTTYPVNPYLGSTLLAFITGNNVTEVAGIAVSMGHGIIVASDSFTGNMTAALDTDGNLLLTGDDAEVTKYAINSSGELTYTTTT